MVVEVYATYDLSIKPHLLLSLVLYKMVDPHSVSPCTTLKRRIHRKKAHHYKFSHIRLMR